MHAEDEGTGIALLDKTGDGVDDAEKRRAGSRLYCRA